MTSRLRDLGGLEKRDRWGKRTVGNNDPALREGFFHLLEVKVDGFAIVTRHGLGRHKPIGAAAGRGRAGQTAGRGRAGQTPQLTDQVLSDYWHRATWHLNFLSTRVSKRARSAAGTRHVRQVRYRMQVQYGTAANGKAYPRYDCNHAASARRGRARPFPFEAASTPQILHQSPLLERAHLPCSEQSVGRDTTLSHARSNVGAASSHVPQNSGTQRGCIRSVHTLMAQRVAHILAA